MESPWKQNTHPLAILVVQPLGCWQAGSFTWAMWVQESDLSSKSAFVCVYCYSLALVLSSDERFNVQLNAQQ